MDNSPDRDKRPAFPAWDGEVQAAMAETNPLRLGEKIYAAETTLSKRLSNLKDSPVDSAERKAIEEALAALHQLQAKTFGPSDWQI
jgi:hypothetical protein